MGFSHLVHFLLSMINESSQNALERFFIKTEKDTFMTQQAFSLARQKIKWEAFRELFDLTVNSYYTEYSDEIQMWNGMRVSAIDGSKLSLPNDKPLRKHFGTSGAGNTSPTAQGSLLYDILNDLTIDARIEPMETDERTIAMMHINQLMEIKSFEKGKELILFDRGYPSFNLIKELMERGIHFVMRVRKKFSTQIDGLRYGDHSIELEQTGEKIGVRVIKFLLPGGEEETLVTDIQDKKLGIEEFKVLYFKRWPIETKYNQIKNRLEIENFSWRLVDNIRQDFYATMVLTNLVADFAGEAQVIVEEEQEGKEKKYEYKVNMNHAIGVLKDWLIITLCEEDKEKRSEMFDKITDMLKKRIIPIRPNRSIPRNTPRNVKFHHNQKSNC